MKAWLSLAAILSASPALAVEPAYLSCTVSGQGAGASLAINLRIDEANENVTVEIPANGVADRRPAIFTSTLVTFTDGPPTDPIQYEISRTDLAIRRIMPGARKTYYDNGTCAIAEPPKRAF